MAINVEHSGILEHDARHEFIYKSDNSPVRREFALKLHLIDRVAHFYLIAAVMALFVSISCAALNFEKFRLLQSKPTLSGLTHQPVASRVFSSLQDNCFARACLGCPGPRRRPLSSEFAERSRRRRDRVP